MGASGPEPLVDTDELEAWWVLLEVCRVGEDDDSSDDLGYEAVDDACIDWEDDRRKNGMALGVNLRVVDDLLGLRGVLEGGGGAAVECVCVLALEAVPVRL